MCFASAPPLSPPINGSCRDKVGECAFSGKRRTPFLAAALCALLGWGLARRLHELLAHVPGDRGAVLGNALLLGTCALVAAVALVGVALGLPRLAVTPRGLTRRSLFRTDGVAWDSLSRFHVERRNGGKTVSATADIIGPNASRRLLRRRGPVFAISDSYRTSIEFIVAEIHDRQTGALGIPAPPSRAASAPVVPEYGIAGFRAPWMTFGLLALLVAAFVAEHRLGVVPETAPFTPNVLTLYAFGGENRGAVFNRGELLRLFSSMLLHLSAAHLIGNTSALLVVGWPLERLVGRSWWLAIFVVGSLVGSMAGLAVYPAHLTLVGASGGIAGLFAARVVLIFRLPSGRRRVFRLVRTALVAVAMFMPAGQQVGFQIGHAAHLGGAVAGAALAAVLLRTWSASRRLPRFRTAGLAIGAGGLALALLGIPVSLRLSREFVASVQGCAGADPDKRVQGCTALIDSGMGDTYAALLGRGRAYLAKERYELAVADLDRVIALAPGSPDAFLSRGYAHLRRGALDQSVADLTEAIRLNPKLGEAYFGRGAAYLDKGQIELAVADESQATLLNPKLASAYTIRGMAHSRKGERSQAIADYSKAVALNGGDADALLYRGSEHLREDRFDAAVADMTKAIELRPASAAAYNARAWALHLKGEDVAALPDAEQAVTLAPSYAPALETRAEIYEKLGRRRDAAADYRAALAIDKQMQLARNGLKRLGVGPGGPP